MIYFNLQVYTIYLSISPPQIAQSPILGYRLKNSLKRLKKKLDFLDKNRYFFP